MHNPKIMIIDDGVCAEGPLLQTDLFADITIDSDLFISQQSKAAHASLEFSHGTICAAIIKKFAPHASLGSLQLLPGDTHAATQEQLLAALAYLRETDVKIIHMSIGTTCLNARAQFASLTQQLHRQGKILVAAVDIEGKYCLPACLSSVVGVHAIHCAEDMILPNQIPRDGVDFLCCGQHTLPAANGLPFCVDSANSFAAPVITAAFAKSDPRVCRPKCKSTGYYPSLDFPHSFVPLVSNPLPSVDLDHSCTNEKWAWVPDDPAASSAVFSEDLFLLGHKDALQGVAFMGSVPDKAILFCKKNKLDIWCETDYQEWIEREFEFLQGQAKLSPTTPTNSLWIQYSTAESLSGALSLLGKVMGFFHARHLSVVGYSDLPHACLSAWQPFPSKAELRDIISAAPRKYSADCLLFFTGSGYDGRCCDFCVIERNEENFLINENQYLIHTPFQTDSFSKICPFLQSWAAI